MGSGYAQHKPKPSNTEAGIEYMLAGATDWSATDPSRNIRHTHQRTTALDEYVAG
jgi:hypothetical protein